MRYAACATCFGVPTNGIHSRQTVPSPRAADCSATTAGQHPRACTHQRARQLVQGCQQSPAAALDSTPHTLQARATFRVAYASPNSGRSDMPHSPPAPACQSNASRRTKLRRSVASAATMNGVPAQHSAARTAPMAGALLVMMPTLRFFIIARSTKACNNRFDRHPYSL
jgi:hypothetical protein